MSNRSETFGRLLKGAINSIATYEGKTAPIIEEELGTKIGLASTSIQRYKAGYLPPDPRTVEIIAEAAVQRGYLYREWLQRFLQAARYHQTDRLLDRLCPIAPIRPRPPRIYQNLPAPTYSQFVMREEAFAEVLDGLRQRSAAVIVVGLGGNGKTSLAREVADRSIKNDDGTALFDAAIWISDKDRPGTTNLSVVLDEIARTLDYPGFTQFEHDEKRREVEQLLRRQRVLVCVDNVETITDAVLLAWLLKLPEPSKTLITTREYRREFRRGGWPVELRGMSDTEARALVDERLKMLRIEKLVSDKGQLEPLVVATGGNPKAIEITLGLVKYERRPLAQVVDDLYAARGALFDDLFDRAWSLLDLPSRRVLLAMTFFPASAIGKALQTSADVSDFTFDQSIERLSDLALLDIQQIDLSSELRYALHPLVRAFAMARLAEQPDFETDARERWVSWYLELGERVGYCPDNVERLALLDTEQETMYQAMEWVHQKDRYHDSIRFGVGSMYYFYVRGLWDKWFAANVMRLDAGRRLRNFNEEVRALAYQVQMLSRQGRIREATEFRQELEAVIQGQYLAEETFFLVYHSIGAYSLALDDFKAARKAWETALAEPERLSHYRGVTSRQWLGLCLYYQGYKEEARVLFQEALREALEHNYGRYILFNRTQLAAIEIDAGQLDQASEELAQSIELARWYNDREQLAYALRLTARLLHERGELVKAKATIAEAIDLFERIGIRRELIEAREELRRLEQGEAPAS